MVLNVFNQQHQELNPLILIGSITNKSAVASGAYDLAIKHARNQHCMCRKEIMI